MDIPTYLVSSVELAARPPTTAAAAAAGGHLLLANGPPRPRLRIDLTKKKPDKAASGRRTQWTVLCVAVTMMTMCVTLVGTMLSVGSEYQDNKVALSFASMREGPPPSSSSSAVSSSSMSSLASVEHLLSTSQDRFSLSSPPASPATTSNQSEPTEKDVAASASSSDNSQRSHEGSGRQVKTPSRLLLALRLQGQS